ncbi:MAG: hypothetical protein KA116_11205 [Proteobacteria bacterium]|nr:hypothetical protein [Pseudomonadota bacterium]
MSHRLYIVLISSLLIFSIFYSLNRSLKAKSFLSSADASDSRSVYIVSPFEWNQLNQDDKLWPKTFHRNFPLTPLQSPKIYDQAQAQLKELDVSPWELELIRSWTVLLNSHHPSALLRALLRDSIEENSFAKAMKSFRYGDYPRCHLFWLEALFRLAQLKEEWRADISKMISSCSAGTESFLWFEMLDTIKASDKKRTEDMVAKLEKQQEIFAEQSFGRFYLEQMIKLLDFAQTHGNKIQFGP